MISAKIDFDVLVQAGKLLHGYMQYQLDLCDEYEGFFHMKEWGKAIQNMEIAEEKANWIISLMNKAIAEAEEENKR